jgi:hypothetical protein
MKLFKLSLFAIIMLGACSLPMHKMREAFSESLKNTNGQTLNDLKYHPGRAFVGSREPTQVRSLSNGNTLHIYDNYWAQYGIDREPCVVFLEFESKEMRVVNASSEGEGCYAAY